MELEFWICLVFGFLYLVFSPGLLQSQLHRHCPHGVDHEADMLVEIDTEFQVDAKELRKLVRIEVEADDVLLRFSPRDKERKVRLDGDRVIIDSKEFARKYRQELGIDGAS